MILGDTAIKNFIHERDMVRNYEPSLIGPASLDVRLGYTLKVPVRCRKGIRLGRVVLYKTVMLKEGQYYKIKPGEFLLATTLEYFKFPDTISGVVHGRSSIGRAGLNVQNAAFCDTGFFGCITLELHNQANSPILITPGYPVAQMVFHHTTTVENPYSGKYNGQVDATESRMFLDMEMRRGTE